MSILSDELSKPEYADLSDQQAADAINAKTVAIRVIVPNTKIKEHAILNSYWPVVKAGQLSSNPQMAGLCVSVIDWIDDPKISNTDMDIAGVQSMIDGLVNFNLMTQQQANALDAFADAIVSWTSQNGLPEVGIGLVINARKEIAAEVQI